MMKLMQYYILSGKVMETRRSYLPARALLPKKRGTRKAGASSLAKIKANEREQVKKLARILNCNLDKSWLHIVLNFDEEHLPANLEELDKIASKFFRTFRADFKKQTDRNPKYIFVPANWSPRKNRPARLHIHLIVESFSVDRLKELWKYGGVMSEDIDGRQDHTSLSVYLIHNIQLSKAFKGRRVWNTSRGNLEKPIYTEPEEVSSYDGIDLPKDAIQTDFAMIEDEGGKIVGAYSRCILAEAPRIRGGQVIIKNNRGRRKRE